MSNKEYKIAITDGKNISANETIKLGHGHFIVNIPEGYVAEIKMRKAKQPENKYIPENN